MSAIVSPFVSSGYSNAACHHMSPHTLTLYVLQRALHMHQPRCSPQRPPEFATRLQSTSSTALASEYIDSRLITRSCLSTPSLCYTQSLYLVSYLTMILRCFLYSTILSTQLSTIYSTTPIFILHTTLYYTHYLWAHCLHQLDEALELLKNDSSKFFIFNQVNFFSV